MFFHSKFYNPTAHVIFNEYSKRSSLFYSHSLLSNACYISPIKRSNNAHLIGWRKSSKRFQQHSILPSLGQRDAGEWMNDNFQHWVR